MVEEQLKERFKKIRDDALYEVADNPCPAKALKSEISQMEEINQQATLKMKLSANKS